MKFSVPAIAVRLQNDSRMLILHELKLLICCGLTTEFAKRV
jgi:hypothetical protein